MSGKDTTFLQTKQLKSSGRWLPVVAMASCLLAGSMDLFAQTASPVDAEARADGQKIWDRILTRCGDSYYLHTEGSGGLTVEYKDVTFQIRARVVSRAARMNGIEWQGVAVMSSLLFRSLRGADSEGHPPEWGRWGDGPTPAEARSEQPGFELGRSYMDIVGFVTVAMAKSNGRWSYSIDVDEVASKKLSCSVIPGTAEYEATQQQKRKEEERQAEIRRQREDVERKQQEAAERKQQEEHDRLIRAAEDAERRSKIPETDLERKTQADGYWLDSRTNLMWTAKDNGSDITAFQTRYYCSCLLSASFSDWRLPTIGELQAMFLPQNSHAIRGFGVSSGSYHIAGGIMLSSQAVRSSSPSDKPRSMLSFEFVKGEPISRDAGVSMDHVLCVRSPAGGSSGSACPSESVTSRVGYSTPQGSVTHPNLLSKVDPTFTEEARKARLAVVALVFLDIDAEGRPRNAVINGHLGMGLDERVLEAVQKWTFSPATQANRPVEARAEIVFEFIP